MNPIATRYDRRAQRVLGNKIAGIREAEERGLEVFSLHPKNIIWGAGRGGNKALGAANEIHSSIPSVLYSYGLVGLFLFSMAFARIHVRGGVVSLIIAAPVWLWSFAHYGLNYSLFWALFAFFAFEGEPAGPVPGRIKAGGMRAESGVPLGAPVRAR